MLILLEGILMCFILLLVCVIGIANGPVGMVTLYEADVQQWVIELGLTTKEKIRFLVDMSYELTKGRG